MRTVELVMEYGADLDAVANNGYDALTYAFTEGHYDKFIAIVEHGASIQYVPQQSWLMFIIKGNIIPREIDLVKALIKQGSDLTETDDLDNTLFMEVRRATILRVLLDAMKEQKIDPAILNKKNKHGETAVMRMFLYTTAGRDKTSGLEMARVLIGAGATPPTWEELTDVYDLTIKYFDKTAIMQVLGIKEEKITPRWNSNMSTGELIQILKDDYGFTNIDGLDYKGRRKEPLLRKLNQLEVERIAKGAAPAAIAR